MNTMQSLHTEGIAYTTCGPNHGITNRKNKCPAFELLAKLYGINVFLKMRAWMLPCYQDTLDICML